MTEESEVEVQEPTSVERATDRVVYTPATDILEKYDEYVLSADMPGATLETIDVTFDKQVLTIRGTCEALEHEGFCLSLSDFEFGDFERAFELSEPVEVDEIKASFKDGVLKVTLPKVVQAKKRVAVENQVQT